MRWVAGLFGLYVLVCALMFLFQRRLLYFPIGEPGAPPEVAGGVVLETREPWIESSDAVRLHAWWLRLPRSRGVVLVCHGNAGNLGDRRGLAFVFLDLGFDVLLFDYRGYGRSSGSPSERGLDDDADAVWTYLVEAEGVDPRRLVLYGESLGGAVAIGLATRKEVGALIVESSFPSLPDTAAALYPWLPVRWLCRDRFPSVDRVGALRMPILQIHSRDDEVVPFALAEKLRAAMPDGARFLVTEGGHNGGGFRSDPGALEEVSAWLQEVIAD